MYYENESNLGGLDSLEAETSTAIVSVDPISAVAAVGTKIIDLFTAGKTEKAQTKLLQQQNKMQQAVLDAQREQQASSTGRVLLYSTAGIAALVAGGFILYAISRKKK